MIAVALAILAYHLGVARSLVAFAFDSSEPTIATQSRFDSIESVVDIFRAIVKRYSFVRCSKIKDEVYALVTGGYACASCVPIEIARMAIAPRKDKR